MTEPEPTPEQQMAGSRERLSGGMYTETRSAPAVYAHDFRADTPVQACGLYRPLGVLAGVLVWDGEERLAWVPVDMDRNEYGPATAVMMGSGLRSAKAAGTPAGEVFREFSLKANQAMAAGPVVEGTYAEVQPSASPFR